LFPQKKKNFFWLQESSKTKDDEYFNKINELINSNPNEEEEKKILEMFNKNKEEKTVEEKIIEKSEKKEEKKNININQLQDIFGKIQSKGIVKNQNLNQNLYHNPENISLQKVLNQERLLSFISKNPEVSFFFFILR
jgi:hypothetical protein